mmetsp:Transcript_61519/g.144058  ORF Transcript_61519/g.144058 Transcript_61519/m.144058 type:complete len:202 (-) Transcript_61519:279-884(-)
MILAAALGLGAWPTGAGAGAAGGPKASLLAAAQRAEDHGPGQAHAVVQRQPHPDGHRVDDEVEGDPEAPHVEVVLHGIPPVFGQRPGNQGLGRCRCLRAGRDGVDTLLDDVEDGEVDEGVMDKVVQARLLHQIQLAGAILQLLGPGEVRKSDCVRTEPGEEGHVDEPLHETEVSEAEGSEGTVPLPIHFLLALSLLHYEVS